MLQCTLSELTQLSEIITSERTMSKKYEQYAQSCVDPQMREIYQKCASIHENNRAVLLDLFNS